MSEEEKKIVSLASSKPSDEEIARDFKYRIQQAMIPVLEIMDEALEHRMHVRWDGIGPISDGFTVKNGITNLQIVRIY